MTYRIESLDMLVRYVGHKCDSIDWDIISEFLDMLNHDTYRLGYHIAFDMLGSFTWYILLGYHYIERVFPSIYPHT